MCLIILSIRQCRILIDQTCSVLLRQAIKYTDLQKIHALSEICKNQSLVLSQSLFIDESLQNTYCTLLCVKPIEHILYSTVCQAYRTHTVLYCVTNLQNTYCTLLFVKPIFDDDQGKEYCTTNMIPTILINKTLFLINCCCLTLILNCFHFMNTCTFKKRVSPPSCEYSYVIHLSAFHQLFNSTLLLISYTHLFITCIVKCPQGKIRS